jgi:hypothetical protein
MTKIQNAGTEVCTPTRSITKCNNIQWQQYNVIAQAVMNGGLPDDALELCLSYALNAGIREMNEFNDDVETRALDLVTPQIWQVLYGLSYNADRINSLEERTLIKLVSAIYSSFDGDSGNLLRNQEGVALGALDIGQLNQTLEASGFAERLRPRSEIKIDPDIQRANELGITIERYKQLLESGRRAYATLTKLGPFYGDINQREPTFMVAAEPFELPKSIEVQLQDLGRVLTQIRNSINDLPVKFMQQLGDSP